MRACRGSRLVQIAVDVNAMESSFERQKGEGKENWETEGHDTKTVVYEGPLFSLSLFISLWCLIFFLFRGTSEGIGREVTGVLDFVTLGS